jgi:hypothetical protein
MASKRNDKNRRREGPCIDKIRALMLDGMPRTTLQVADALGFSLVTSVVYFRHASHPGEFQEVHSVDNMGMNGAPRYVWGKGKNKALKRAPRYVKPEDEMTDRELDAQHRGFFKWWPEPDLLVIRTIDSMVRMGARA